MIWTAFRCLTPVTPRPIYTFRQADYPARRSPDPSDAVPLWDHRPHFPKWTQPASAEATQRAVAKARLRGLRDGAAASLPGSDPLASELLARAAVVYGILNGILNGIPTFMVLPPAEGLTILEGDAPCDFAAAELGHTTDAEIQGKMRDWARSAVERGLVRPIVEVQP